MEDNFHTIVLGTGLVESIIAGALARSGKSVLHLDQQDRYGGSWPTLNIRQLLDWVDEHGSGMGKEVDNHVKTIVENGSAHVGSSIPIYFTDNESQGYKHVELRIYGSSIPERDHKEVDVDTTISIDVASIPLTDGTSTRQSVIRETVQNKLDNTLKHYAIGGLTSDILNRTIDRIIHSLPPTSTVTIDILPHVQQLATYANLLSKSRQFNIDLAPKLVSCTGSMVDNLMDSGIGRYLEFKGVERTYMYTQAGEQGPHFDRVPVSKEDVFQDKELRYVDKRRLMKFLTFAMEHEEQLDVLDGYQDKPYRELIEEKFSISTRLADAIVFALAATNGDAHNVTAMEGLSRTKRFMTSIGKFGPFAYLVPLYGGGSEIAQAYCRVCAVYGGIYMLDHPVSQLCMDENKEKVTGVIGRDGVEYKCEWLVAGTDYLPSSFLDGSDQGAWQWVNMAVAITSAPFHNEVNEVNLTVFPPQSHPYGSYILTVGHGTQVCPEGYYIVFYSTLCGDDEAKSDDALQSALSATLNVDEDPISSQPKPLLLLKYKRRIRQIPPSSLPFNLISCRGPDDTLDYDGALKEAKDAFDIILANEPDRLFLPRPEEMDEE
ncbi:hypothetical protein BZG36_04735 [Bifiguratus adelaidae]|uniref:Rab proteins geranylgeranyltransferase component n=1 Tax=Bifiguratus adelaidae TaxID=1938954 RepID=A0A261XUS4_9FUNG|nr:hypothetical protein BZG36_04735 [Bifiguratus adelaidae]